MSFQYASWPVPAGVYAGWTTRVSGVSREQYSNNNIAHHVGDLAALVNANRNLLRSRLMGYPEICWLNQTHSTNVVEVSQARINQGQDGCFTREKGIACAVMTADCLPVFLWTKCGSQIAVVHAGWRGLAHGILLNALSLFPSAEQVICGIGPAISAAAFEVGDGVKRAFADWPDSITAFTEKPIPGKYWCDLALLAESQLRKMGVFQVYQSNQCTYENDALFYSYRRDGQTGRMANLIWKV